MYFTEQFENNPNCAYIRWNIMFLVPKYSHKNTKPAKGESVNCLLCMLKNYSFLDDTY